MISMYLEQCFSTYGWQAAGRGGRVRELPGGPEALPSGIWCCLTKSTRSGDPSSEELRNVPCPIRSGNRFRSTCVSVFGLESQKKEGEKRASIISFSGS